MDGSGRMFPIFPPEDGVLRKLSIGEGQLCGYVMQVIHTSYLTLSHSA